MKLLGTAVMILPDDNPEKTEKGIYIPRTAKEKPLTGKVIDAGDGCESVSAGQKVFYNRKSASIMEMDGVEYYLVNEEQILAYYE